MALLFGRAEPFVILCNYAGGNDEHFCEIILNLNQLFWRCGLKIFLTYSSASPFVLWSKTICSILVGSL